MTVIHSTQGTAPFPRQDGIKTHDICHKEAIPSFYLEASNNEAECFADDELPTTRGIQTLMVSTEIFFDSICK